MSSANRTQSNQFAEIDEYLSMNSKPNVQAPDLGSDIHDLLDQGPNEENKAQFETSQLNRIESGMQHLANLSTESQDFLKLREGTVKNGVSLPLGVRDSALSPIRSSNIGLSEVAPYRGETILEESFEAENNQAENAP